MLELLFPPCCGVCRARGTELCASCAGSLPPAPDLGPPPGLEACWSLLEHRDTGRAVVMALKYDRHLDAAGVLGAAMAELVDRTVSLVTWAPTSAPRRHRRGFDQAEVLAGAVAAALDRPCVSLLERTSTSTQVGHGRAERLRGPRFHARARACVAPVAGSGPVLVVDDVRTTGATLCAAAEALWSSGVEPVLGLTLSVRR